MVFYSDQIFHSLTQCEIEQRSQFQNGAVRPNSGGSKRERRRSNLADIQVGWFVSVMLNSLLLIEHHDYGCHGGGDEHSLPLSRTGRYQAPAKPFWELWRREEARYRVPQKKCPIANFSLNLFQRSDYTFSHVLRNQNFEPVPSKHFKHTHSEY